MTAAELGRFIGRRAFWKMAGVEVEVEIIDARKCWDRVDAQIRIIAGRGVAWVAMAKLTQEEPGENRRRVEL